MQSAMDTALIRNIKIYIYIVDFQCSVAGIDLLPALWVVEVAVEVAVVLAML